MIIIINPPGSLGLTLLEATGGGDANTTIALLGLADGQPAVLQGMDLVGNDEDYA